MGQLSVSDFPRTELPGMPCRGPRSLGRFRNAGRCQHTPKGIPWWGNRFGGGGGRNATFQEVGRIPSVPPPQSQSRKRALTLPQPTDDGVPSQPSTFSGVVSNGHKPGGAAERKGCRAGLPACTQAPEASHTRHQGDLPNQNLERRGRCLRRSPTGNSPYCEVLEAP